MSDASGAHCEACPAGKYAASSGSCAPIEGQAYSHDFSDFTVKPGEEVLGSGPSTAVGAIGKSLDKLASVLLRERVERDIEGYVRRADPEVQSLLVALRAYVAAARVDVESVLAGQIQVIAAFERLTGLGAAATIAPCRVGAAAATAPEPPGKADGKDAAPDRASPETVTLRLVNQSLSLIGM